MEVLIVDETVHSDPKRTQRIKICHDCFTAQVFCPSISSSLWSWLASFLSLLPCSWLTWNLSRVHLGLMVLALPVAFRMMNRALPWGRLPWSRSLVSIHVDVLSSCCQVTKKRTHVKKTRSMDMKKLYSLTTLLIIPVQFLVATNTCSQPITQHLLNVFRLLNMMKTTSWSSNRTSERRKK